MRPATDIAMQNMVVFVSNCRRLAAAAVLGVGIALAATGAGAQNVVVLVNGDPITNLDIEHRSRLLQLVNNRAPARQEVLDELIDEKLKLQLPRRFDFTGFNIDAEVENAINNMARRRRVTQQQFAQDLASRNVPISTLKSRVKAEIMWTHVIRGKYSASLQLNDSEILKALEGRNKEEVLGYDYTLHPIVIVVPRGSPQALIEARRREAEALRVRFQNCEEGIPFVRALREVVLRPQVTRSSADLPQQLRDILEKTEVGRLTPVESTSEGFALYAVCAKKQSSKENAPGRREVREEIYSKQFQASARKYIQELRKQAYIQYK